MSNEEKIPKEITDKFTGKTRKVIARRTITELCKNDKIGSFKANVIGFKYNEAGKFASLIISIEAMADTSAGKLNLIRDIQIPISLEKDIVI